MKVKKKQHYVWRFYLKQWCDERENIACCRNGKIFRSDLMGVAQENYFYKLEEITDEEAIWVEEISIDNNYPKLLKEMDKKWIDTYRLPFQFIRKLKERGITNEEVFNKIINEGEENIYCLTEELGKPYLEKLYKEDILFYDKFDEKADFNIYICEQYFRTKKRLEALKSIPARGIEIAKLWGIFRHIYATNLSFNLSYRKDKKFVLKLLKNQTEINFITGDQPVINRYATKEQQGKSVDKFEFYYPITPRLAIYITENNYTSEELNMTDEKYIIELNDLIFYNSQEQIYSSSEKELERYKKMVRD